MQHASSGRIPARLARQLLLASTVSAATLAAVPALAQTAASGVSVAQATTDTDAAVRNYWTPERIRGARNLDLHVTGLLRHGRLTAPSHAPRQVVQGAMPTVAFDEDEVVRLPDAPRHAEGTGVSPGLVGTSGAPFTTNRLYPVKDVYKSYPYATVGHLFFTTPNGNFQCSASVVRRSVIATAGHCVADGNGNYYSNWMFIPAQNGSVEPFGAFTWSNAWTSSGWWSGGGTVPNEQDDALIILASKKYHGATHAVGDLTGWLGYEYDAPLPTAMSQLGYPCNLDNCSDPVATYTQPLQGPDNNYVFGSASAGGASGGPEIQDFGVAPSGVPSETLGGNILISSLSFLYTATGYEEDGASVLYAPGEHGERTFGDLITWACGAGAC